MEQSAHPEQFTNVISSPINLIFWHSVFMSANFLIVSAGIKDGIGRVVKILMPLLRFLMIFMVFYSMFNGDFTKAILFLFAPDFSNVTSETLSSSYGTSIF